MPDPRAHASSIEGRHSMTAYEALAAEAAAQQLPKHYVTDLTVHDRNALQTLQPAEFAWVLRNCGTHLLPAGIGRHQNGVLSNNPKYLLAIMIS